MSLKGLRWASDKGGKKNMLRILLIESPAYIAMFALGLIGIYRVRDYLLRRQRRKDAEREKLEESEAEQI